MNKIEKEIGIKRYTAPEPNQGEVVKPSNPFETQKQERQKQVIIDSSLPKTSPIVNKTIDLFAKAREALTHSQGDNVKENTIVQEKVPKLREIQPMQKRTGLLHRGREHVKNPSGDPISPGSTIKSPNSKVEIPFSKNRYSKESNNEELTQENNKKAIKYLKSQKATRKLKEEQKKILLEK